MILVNSLYTYQAVDYYSIVYVYRVIISSATGYQHNEYELNMMQVLYISLSGISFEGSFLCICKGQLECFLNV